ncbi:MAG: nucleotidyltransferase family protein [Clostridia bacterium]|nr:nucleotidyltransferase family protein [Clostridia bacterium]
MKIAGIIAEYNPFHNGHAHHIAETRKKTGCDYIVVCMDGSYTQRGEVACLDKWTRARAALACGADAVFELPALWAVNTADYFARGGVTVLGKLGCDFLSFGSEDADLALLERLADLREHEPKEISRAVQSKLSEGKSHARARGEALAQHLGLDADKLNAPNLTLGVEYIRAIRELKLNMQPVVIPRIGGYHDSALGTFASASAIRDAVHRGENPAEAVPQAMREHLPRIAQMHAPDDLLLHTLRSMTEDEIACLPGVAEGLEKRIARCVREASSQEELIDMLKCKRYTRARIARLCAHALLGIGRELQSRHPLPEYARILGMREDARPLLAELKSRSALPIVSDAAKLQDNEIFHLECRATDLRALQCNESAERKAGQEFTQKFIRT